MPTRRALAAVLAVALTTLPAHAQMGSGNGFLFRDPKVRLELAAGYAAPRGRSDIYDFLTSELTLSRGDFASAGVNASATVRVSPRVQVGVSASYAGRTAGSEDRHFTGEDNLPILQSTTLDRGSFMATARLALRPSGRMIGRYAWIPNRVVPFVGGGAGLVWYRLRQSGEFVDKQTLDIFNDQFSSNGVTLGATGFGGADVSVTPRYGVSLTGRYLWGRGTMNGDFSTYNKIDLSGYDASVGLYVRF